MLGLILSMLTISLITSLIPQGYASTTTYFDANSYSRTIENQSAENWATVHDASTGTIQDNTTEIWTNAWHYVGQYYLVDRAFLFFDTSSLPDSCIIINASLQIFYFGGQGSNLTIQNGQPTYPHYPLISSDYAISHYSGNGGSRVFSQGGTPTWNNYNITMTAEGLTWINKTGITKLAVFEGVYDIPNIAPDSSQHDTYWPRLPSQGQVSRLFVTYTITPTVTITYPTNTTYTTSTIPVDFSASGGTIDKLWYNCKHNGSWLFSNTTYTTPTTMTISNNGAYTFYAWANNTESVKGNGTVTFFYGSCILTVITKDAEDNQLLNGVSVSINTLDMLLSFGSGKTINGLVNFHLPFNQSFLICASKPFYHRVNDTVFMDADKNDTLVLSLGVNENEGGIFLTDVPTNLANSLGIPVIAGQILVCLILAALFLFPIFIVSKGDIVIITVSSVVLLGFFTGVGWINYFVFLVLGGIIAAMWANKIAKWISGG